MNTSSPSRSRCSKGGSHVIEDGHNSGELVVAKGGSKLTPAKESPAAPVTVPPPPGPGSPLPPEDMRQGIRVLRKTPAVSEMTVKGETLDIWVQSPFLGAARPIVNKTGLPGKYDFTLNWAPNQPGTSGQDVLSAPGETDLPSLFTALQEQLGLKLVPTKAPVEVIIIDHIELPSDN